MFLKFYEEALGLKVVREKEASDGSFKLVYLGDGITDFQLELTWLKDRTEPYDLGDEEFHLAFETDDYESFHKRHKEMGCICFENPGMGIVLHSGSGWILDRDCACEVGIIPNQPLPSPHRTHLPFRVHLPSCVECL